MNRNKISGAVIDSVSEISSEALAKGGEKFANSNLSGNWQELDEWIANWGMNEHKTRTHALFSRLSSHKNGLSAVSNISNLQAPESHTYEVASAIQTSLMSDLFETAHDLKGYLEGNGYQVDAVNGGLATYGTVKATGDEVLAVVNGFNAVDPVTQPSIVEYVSKHGEFYGIDVSELPTDITDLTEAQKEAIRDAVDAFSQHKAEQEHRAQSTEYGALVDSLKSMGASQAVLEQLAKGSGVSAHNNSNTNPAMGAAIQRGISGRSVVDDPSFSHLDKLAGERARLEHEKFDDPLGATKAAMDVVAGVKSGQYGDGAVMGLSNENIEDLALSAYRDDLVSGPPEIRDGSVVRGSFEVGNPNYAGPSHEFSPEDFMTKAQLDRQLEKNTAIRDMRNREAMATPSERALFDGLTSFFKGDRLEAASKMWDTPAPTNTNKSGYKTDELKVTDKSLLDVAKRNGMSVQEVVALNKDKVTREGNVEVGQSLTVYDKFEEADTPSRSSPVSDKKSTSMDNLNAYVDKISRETAAQLSAQNPYGQWSSQMSPVPAAMPSLSAKKNEAPISIGPASRFNKAEMVESPQTQALTPSLEKSPTAYASAFATPSKSASNAVKADAKAGTKEEEQAVLGVASVLDVPKENVEQVRAAKDAFLGGQKQSFKGVSAAQAQQAAVRAGRNRDKAEALSGNTYDGKTAYGGGMSPFARGGTEDYEASNSDYAGFGTENISGSRGMGDQTTGGGYGANGNYQSGTTSQGNSTGGVGLDEFGREVGAWGQLTRDVVGRGNGSAADGNTRVICTELVRQGLMKSKLQRLDIAFTFKHLSPVTVRGYHFWAVPYVRLMRRSTLATRFVEPFARWRAEEIAYQMGALDKPNVKGKLVRLIGEPICWALGMVLGWTGDPDRFYPLGVKI